jgi:hypothetical protein
MCSLGYKQFSEPSNIAPADGVEEVARAGAFCPSVPPARRIGDVVAHGGNRVVNAIFTRVFRDVGRTWGVGAAGKKRVFDVWNEVRDEASRLPVAERGDRPPATKGTLDIGATQFFLSHQSFGDKVAEAVKGGGHKVQLEAGAPGLAIDMVVRTLFLVLCQMAQVWKKVGTLTMEDVAWYSQRVVSFSKIWKALGWSVPVWTHWVIRHSSWVARQWRTFSLFSTIPLEFRNGPFKMDIRHCFQGWKLGKPYLTRGGLKVAIGLDGLDWGLDWWEATHPDSSVVRKGRRHRLRARVDKKK